MEPKKTRVKVGLLDFEYTASLFIAHPQLNPDDVSHALKMSPRRSHRAGEARRTPVGRPLAGVYPTGCWSVELETRDGEDVAEFLMRIVRKFESAKTFLRGIVDDGGDVECFVGLFATQLCDQIFPAKLLYDLGQLGIDLRLDYYDVSRENNRMQND